MRRPRKGRGAPDIRIDESVAVELTKAQAEDRDAIFHGMCHGCLNKRGNNSGYGMHYCLGCAISCWSETLPNRRIAEADQKTIELHDDPMYGSYRDFHA